MKIGLVLSNSPTYSETFFRSKINGLLQSVFQVTLFVQKSNPDFTLFNVIITPKVDKTNPILQFFRMFFVSLECLMRYPIRFIRFIKLEGQAMASSRIVIGSNISGVKDVLKAFPQCIFQPCNIDDLTEKIKTVKEMSQSYKQELAKAMRTYVENELSVTSFVEKHENLYVNVSK